MDTLSLGCQEEECECVSRRWPPRDRRRDEVVEQARKDVLRGGGPEGVAGVLHDDVAHEAADVAAAQRRLGVTEKIGEAVVTAAEYEQARGPSGGDSAEVAGEGVKVALVELPRRAER